MTDVVVVVIVVDETAVPIVFQPLNMIYFYHCVCDTVIPLIPAGRYGK